MTVLAAIAYFSFIFENDYLIAFAVFLYRGYDPRTVNEWLTDRDIIAIAEKQHSGEFDIAALSRVQAFDVDGLALGYSVLFATRFNYSVNFKPPKIIFYQFYS